VALAKEQYQQEQAAQRAAAEVRARQAEAEALRETEAARTRSRSESEAEALRFLGEATTRTEVNPKPKPRPEAATRTRSEASSNPAILGGARAKKQAEVDEILAALTEAGDPKALGLEDVKERFGLKHAAAWDRLSAARDMWAEAQKQQSA
jgi:hypothetical protein